MRKARWMRAAAGRTMRRAFGALALAGLAGCASPLMKSTPFYEGAQTDYRASAEERVNLWPLAYFRDPALSVLWPLSGFNLDDGSGWTLPAYWSRDGFTLFPLCRFGADSSGVLPLFYRSEERLLTPAWCSWEKADTCGWSVPPLLTKGSFYRTNDEYEVRALLGFVGAKRRDTGVDTWCFPLWDADARGFASPLWTMRRDGDGAIRSWVVPPLLTWWDRAGGVDELDALCGLGGRQSDSLGTRSSWLLPLYYANRDGDFYTALFGRSARKDANWVFPVWYVDARSFMSLPWCSRVGEDGTDTWTVPLLLTYGRTNREKDVASVRPLFGLAGWDAKGGAYARSWCFPLYGHVRERSFVSPLYGRTPDSAWWTPAVIRKGERWLLGLGLGGWAGVEGVERSWLFPLYWANHGSGEFATVPFGRVGGFSWWLTPLFGRTETAWWATPLVGRYERDGKCGNWVFPLAGWGEDEGTEWSQFLFGVLWNSETDRRTGDADRSVLWRMWHYARKDGDESTDMFPFVTHDRKRNGREKTSFLWRAYSRETDAQGNSRLHLLFLPVR